MKVISASLSSVPCSAVVLNYNRLVTFTAETPERLAKVIAKDDRYLESVAGTLAQLLDANLAGLAIPAQPAIAATVDWQATAPVFAGELSAA